MTWWRDHALLDDVSEDIDVATGRVTNELRLRQLRRTDLHSILTCQATNNNISVPASTSVKLDMQCKQLHLYIKTVQNMYAFCIYFVNPKFLIAFI